MTISLRLAGFEVRDVIEWLYFSGFPKSMDVIKAIDKKLGAEREVVAIKKKTQSYGYEGNNVYGGDKNRGGIQEITAPATDLAKKWDGWGTALKPAHEPIIMARKPLVGTVAENVERFGTGAINIDGCRIGDEKIVNKPPSYRGKTGEFVLAGTPYTQEKLEINTGRFPANCVTLEDDQFYSKYFNITPPELSKKASKKDRNSDWRGEEIGLEPKDSGSLVASTRGQLKDLRISNPEYERKVPKNANFHPTVKPTDLMAWLCRLVTPPGGIVLDPFAGSGSTLVVAKREGFQYIGIEREAEYCELINKRMSNR